VRIVIVTGSLPIVVGAAVVAAAVVGGDVVAAGSSSPQAANPNTANPPPIWREAFRNSLLLLATTAFSSLSGHDSWSIDLDDGNRTLVRG